MTTVTSRPACQQGRSLRRLSMALAAMILTGCRGQPPQPPKVKPPAGTITVTDQQGHTLTLAHLPERIISIAPSNTELLFALGLGHHLIAVTSDCNYPPEAAAKEKIGDFKPSIERIAALAPDLVVAVRDLQPDTIRKLSEATMPVLVLDPYTWDRLYQATEILGQATGAAAAARKLVAEMKAQREQVLAKTKGLRDDQRPKVFVEISNQPLMAAGPGTFVDELIKDAGGRNVAAGAKVEWAQFSPEAVVQADPDFILTTIEGDAQNVKKRAGWQSVSAVRKGQVYELDPDLLLRPGPRLLQGLQRTFALLHPELAEAGHR